MKRRAHVALPGIAPHTTTLHPDTYRSQVVHFSAEAMTDSLNRISARERFNVLAVLVASWRRSYPPEDQAAAWADFVQAVEFADRNAR